MATRYSGIILLGLALGTAAVAKDVAVKLSGAHEVPAVTSTASGEGKLTVGDDMSVTGSITTKGIDGTMAHIHLAPAGKNGPPVITLTKSGENQWTVPAGSKLTAEQYESYKKGELYINVHSAAHPGGEIRAQVKP